jgi:hypothetical protein
MTGHNNSTLPEYYKECSIWYISALTVQMCIKHQIENTNVIDLWKQTGTIIQNCIGHPIIKDALQIAKFQNKVCVCIVYLKSIAAFWQDEIKLGVMPKSLSDECLLVTAGIGNDIQAEQNLQKVLPHCRFVGVTMFTFLLFLKTTILRLRSNCVSWFCICANR